MGQFTVEVSATGHKVEVVTAENGQEAFEEATRAAEEELPDWVNVVIRDVRPEGQKRLSDSDD